MDGIPARYGSATSGSDQHLNQPLCLLDDGNDSYSVINYQNHRIHQLTKQLQFVRHLVTRVADISWPRHVCLEDNILRVGQHDEVIYAFNIAQQEDIS